MRKAAMRSVPTKNAPLGNKSWPASVGLNARTDTANDGIRNALPNNAAPATKLTIKAKQKSSDRNKMKSSRRAALRRWKRGPYRMKRLLRAPVRP